ncbi:MAG: RHS repeat-associated core domain-containing protein, partial [Candidatus Nanopelagicales bacterium]|nr:RHS repeat-associated core domain-containing protein [Candidatus Nanopelagicales bacterium]
MGTTLKAAQTSTGEYSDAWTFTDSGRVASRTHSDTSAGSDPVSFTYTYGDTARPDAVTGLVPSTGEASSYTYTSSGQRATTTTGAETSTTAWDVTGRPTSLTTPSGVMSYWYGADGLFATTSATAGSVVFAGATQLSVKDGVVSGRRSYTLGGATTGFRDTAVNASVVSPAANDVQGSATIQTDPAALSAAAGWVKHTYTPYGSALASTGGLAWSGINGWLNKPALPGAGLSQVGARQYDPVLQQFTSPDPLIDPSQPGGFNPYTYAGNNPTTYSDPSGLSTLGIGAALGIIPPPLPTPISNVGSTWYRGSRSSIGNVSGTADVGAAPSFWGQVGGFASGFASEAFDMVVALAPAVLCGAGNLQACYELGAGG